MDINGVGGIGIGGWGASSLIDAPASVNSLVAPQAPVNAAMLAGIASGRMDQLVKLINGFSTAEILLALMLTDTNSTSPRRSRETCDATVSLDMELLLAGQTQNQVSDQLPLTLAEMAAPVTGLIGGELNIQA